jgi:hypothetical protein
MLMLDRILSAFVAICLALLIWLYARSRDQEVLDHVPIPVDVSLGGGQNEQYILEIVGAPQVLASFTAPPSRLRELRSLLQNDQLRVELTYTVPADRLKENRLNETLLVEPSDLHAPSGVTASLVTGRNQIRLVLHRLGEKQLPVHVDQSLESLGSAYLIEPSVVKVRGPLEVLERTRVIPTQPCLMPNLGSKRATSVPLVQQIEGQTIVTDPAAVKVRLVSSQKSYELEDLPVQVLTPAGFPYQARFRGEHAGQVTLRVVGPAKDEAPNAYAYLDLTGKVYRDLAQSRTPKVLNFEEQVQIHLPPGFCLEDGPTHPLAFELVPMIEAKH